MTKETIKKIDDDGKPRQRFSNKRVNAKKEGIGFCLTYEEYCSLVISAGLVSSQLGFTGQNYVLARYNDFGDYTPTNCRFITQKENMAEQRISEEETQRRRIRVIRLNKYMDEYRRKHPRELSRKIKRRAS